MDQGRRWLDAALAAHDGSPSLARAQALVAAGELAFRQGDQAAARSWTTRSLEHAQLLGQPPTAALAHTNLARIALRDGDAGAIERHARAGIQAAGDELDARSRAVHMLAWAAHPAGDLQRARAVFTESLELRRRLGDRLGQAVELGNPGELARGAGDAWAAAALLLEALELAAELDSRYLLPGLLASLAVLAGERGDVARAARLLGASQAHDEAAGWSLTRSMPTTPTGSRRRPATAWGPTGLRGCGRGAVSCGWIGRWRRRAARPGDRACGRARQRRCAAALRGWPAWSRVAHPGAEPARERPGRRRGSLPRRPGRETKVA